MVPGGGKVLEGRMSHVMFLYDRHARPTMGAGVRVDVTNRTRGAPYGWMIRAQSR